jgi:hypothetical protein
MGLLQDMKVHGLTPETPRNEAIIVRTQVQSHHQI